jgi:hypothetical protein
MRYSSPQWTYDNPRLRRAIEKDPAAKQEFLRNLHKWLEAAEAAAWSPKWEAEMRQMAEEWERLPQSEKDAQYQEAQRNAKLLEDEMGLAGQDWSDVGSTEKLPDHVVGHVVSFMGRHLVRKHVDRTLAEFEWRFNRRYDLAAMMPRLASAATHTPPMPYRLQKLVECWVSR